jgi:hypothetical protein
MAGGAGIFGSSWEWGFPMNFAAPKTHCRVFISDDAFSLSGWSV